MSAPATCYKFGQKNQWRRTIWNRIRERLRVAPSDAVVLYLPGPENLDRMEATRRGFGARNLIGVDRSEKCVRELRSSGQLAICGDFVDVLEAWNPQRPVGVIFGDFCCGLERDMCSRLFAALLNPAFQNAVVALNFLRGRDPSSKEQREELQTWTSVGKHRGEQFLLGFVISLLNLMIQRRNEAGEPVSEDEIVEYLGRIRNLCGDATLTYRSTSNQTFDSVVFKTWVWAGNWDLGEQEGRLLPVKRLIAATLAHRTMRAA